MRVLRRAWRVLADPPTSGEAFLLAWLALPIGAVSVATWWAFDLHGVPPAKPVDLVWGFLLLWAIRQRDEARAEGAALRNAKENAR